MRWQLLLFLSLTVVLATIALRHLDGAARWLVVNDKPVPADAILVLDGGGVRFRFAAGLDLLYHGYAPRLFVSQSIYASRGILSQEMSGGTQSLRIHWLHNAAVSTREEAQVTREALRRLGCRRLLVVTSNYHTRRARLIFRRELRPDGIEVRVYAASTPEMNVNNWWETREGRVIVLSECAKLLATWLHFDPAISGEFRNRVKSQLQASIP